MQSVPMTVKGDGQNIINNNGRIINNIVEDNDNSSPHENDDSLMMEGGKVVVRKHRKNITYPDIAQCFDMPIRDAAQILGISLTQLKRLCREFNIPRWPYRRLNSIQRRIEVLTIMMERNVQSGGDDRAMKDTRDEMRKLEEEARSIKEDPTIVTKQGLDLDGCTSTTFIVQAPNSSDSGASGLTYNTMHLTNGMYPQDMNRVDSFDDPNESRQELLLKYSDVQTPKNVGKKRKNAPAKGGEKNTKRGKKVKAEGENEDDEGEAIEDENNHQKIQTQRVPQNEKQSLMMMVDPMYNPNITNSRRRQVQVSQPMLQHSQEMIQNISPTSPAQQNAQQRITSALGRVPESSSLLSFMNHAKNTVNSGAMVHHIIHQQPHQQQDRMPSPPRTNMSLQPYAQNNHYTATRPSMHYRSLNNEHHHTPSGNPISGGNNIHNNVNGSYIPNIPSQLLQFDVASVHQDLENRRKDNIDGGNLRKFSVSSLFDRRQSSIGDLLSSTEDNNAQQPSQRSIENVGTLLSPLRRGSIGSTGSFDSVQPQDGDVMRLLHQMQYTGQHSSDFFPQSMTADNKFHG